MKTTESDAATRRYNIYLNIRKALRTFMSQTLAAVGRVDPSDDREVAVVSDVAGCDACSAR